MYGEEYSRIRPGTYTIIFISCDFLSLLLQAIGGALASTANTPSQDQTGINIMIAGLSTQVASLVLFMTLCSEFAWRVVHLQPELNHPSATITRTFRFKAFLVGKSNMCWCSIAKIVALPIATICIFIRSCFRVAELSGGFHGKLANQQITFMILEGAMIIIACILLTVLHPGFSFQGEWQKADFSFKRGNKDNEEKGSSAELN
jgi:hypothetical protein